LWHARSFIARDTEAYESDQDGDEDDGEGMDFDEWVSGEDAHFTPAKAIGGSSNRSSRSSHTSAGSAFDNRDTLLSAARPMVSSSEPTPERQGQQLLSATLAHESDSSAKVSPETAASVQKRPVSLRGSCSPQKTVASARNATTKEMVMTPGLAAKKSSQDHDAVVGKLTAQLDTLQQKDAEQEAELKRLRNLLSKPSARETRMANDLKALRKKVGSRSAHCSQKRLAP